MANTAKLKIRRSRSSKTAPPQSDRVRVLTSISNTMQEFRTRQGALDAAWRWGGSTVSNYSTLPTPPSPPSQSSLIEGILDTSFGTNGFNLTTPGTNDWATGMAIQLDDKIVAGGNATMAGASGFCLVRYNSNGSIDTTFGTNGFNTNTTGTNAGITGVAVQPDGKIVVGGTSDDVSGNTGFAFARYNPDGSLDTTFGTAGFVTGNYGTSIPSTYINALILQPDGKILACGSIDDTFFMGRYNPDGSLDPTFGTNGYTTVTPGTSDVLYRMRLQSDGKIVAGGYSSNVAGNTAFAIIRYNSNGSLDTAFGTNGFNTTTLNTGDSIYALGIQQDGKIVVGGYTGPISGSSDSFALARYNSNGSLDTSFGSGGFNKVTPGTDDGIAGIVIRPDGKIIAGGWAGVSSGTAFAVVGYNLDGSLDTSFGKDGFNLDTPGNSDSIYALSSQSNGKIIAVGYYSPGTGSTFVVCRYI